MARGTFSKIISCALGVCLSVWCVPAAAWAQDAEAQPDSGAQAAASAAADSPAGENAPADERTPENPSDAETSSAEETASHDQQLPAGESNAADSEQESPALQASSAESESVQIPDGFYTIHSALDSAYVLDVAAASNESGANTQLWSGNGSLAQTWYVSRQNDGTYTVEALCSGLFLDVKWASRDAGANVWQYSASGTASQKWKIVARSKMGDFLKAQDAAAKDL